MPRARKVLLAAQYLGIGGLERMMLSLAKGLSESGKYLPQVLSYDCQTGAPSLESEFEKEEIRVFRLRKGIGFSWKTANDLHRILAENDFQLLHTHDLGPLIYGQIARFTGKPWRRPCPLVHTQHSFVHLAHATHGRRYGMYEKIFASRVSKLCAVSEAIGQQYLELGIRPSLIEKIENGVFFPSQAQYLHVSRTQIRSQLLPKEAEKKQKTWVLSLARLHPRKGQDHLIRAWGRMTDSIQAQAVLILVGPETDAAYARYLRSLANEAAHAESIVFAGPSLQPESWLIACDAFASGSEWEGMPLGPIEALGLGIPTALSDIDGHRLLKGEAESFDLRSQSDITAKLENIIRADSSPEARALRFKDRQSFRDRYAVHRMIEKYEKIYDQFLL